MNGVLQYKWVITIEYIQSNSVSLSELVILNGFVFKSDPLSQKLRLCFRFKLDQNTKEGHWNGTTAGTTAGNLNFYNVRSATTQVVKRGSN